MKAVDAQPRSRREEYAEASRVALLDAAARRFVEEGFAATTLDAVAADARMTKGAVYHHFANKQALFEAVLERVEEGSVADILEAGAPATTVWEACLLGLDRAFDLFMDRTYQRLLFEEGPIALGYQRWHDFCERHELGLIRDMLEGLHAEGRLCTDDVGSLAQLLYGVLCAAATAIARADDQQAARDRMSALAVRIVEGLRPATAG